MTPNVTQTVSDGTFISMTLMSCMTLIVTLFNLTGFISSLVPYFQLAALAMTIYVGYRTIRKDKKRKYEK